VLFDEPVDLLLFRGRGVLEGLFHGLRDFDLRVGMPPVEQLDELPQRDLGTEHPYEGSVVGADLGGIAHGGESMQSVQPQSKEPPSRREADRSSSTFHAGNDTV
jgi:hypothetical protein